MIKMFFKELKQKNIIGKKSVFGLLIIILIFVFYDFLKPMEHEDHTFNKAYTDQFSFSSRNISESNMYAMFKDYRNGDFFIHPGEKKPVVGVFSFKNKAEVLLELSIKETGKAGKILYTIKHNEDSVSSHLVTLDQAAQIQMFVNKGDIIEVEADNYNGTAQDHGFLTVSTRIDPEKNKSIIISVLWVVFFVILFRKNYLYLFVSSYSVFLLMLFAEKLNFGIITFSEIVNYSLFLFSIAFLIMILFQSLSRYKRFKVASSLSFLIMLSIIQIPLMFVIYALNFGVEVTEDTLFAVLQTNSGEAVEYIDNFIGFQYIVLLIIFTLFIYFCLYRQEKESTVKMDTGFLIFIPITFLTTVIGGAQELRLPMLVTKSYDQYYHELTLFRRIQERRNAGSIDFVASKEKKGETYLVVIGESLNKKHMGLYGYFRNTTPLLSEIAGSEGFIPFANAYSNHTHTVPTLKYSLTEANQYNGKDYYSSVSILDVLNEADFETYWLTNQLMYGEWDNMVSVIASSAEELVAINKSIGKSAITQNYDEELIKEVRQVISKDTGKNKVIFVHLMGNHVSYANRYPEDAYKVFSGQLNQGEFGINASQNPTVNEYDNSVLYNDFVVGSILKELQQEERCAGFLYVSDHADDVINRLGHNFGQFTYEMTQIPLIFWVNDQYRKQYESSYNNLLSNRNKLFSNDLLYNTLIGMLNVSTDRYTAKYDLTSDNYSLDPDKALVLHGAKNYVDSDNYIYWQKRNAEFLNEAAQKSRVFPHRVNSVGKLREIWNDGFRSFEVDALFEGGDFRVGHNEGLLGYTLEEFLMTIDYAQIKKIWIDFKNLNKDNHREALVRLNYLDEKFGIKNKAIIESGSTLDLVKSFTNDQWHTSYYLPTSALVELVNENRTVEMQQVAIKISQQARNQGVKAVSFDHRLYPFVKTYLEKLLSTDVVYHIWYAPHLNSTNFQEELMDFPPYKDERVKSLLSIYQSQFNL